MKHCLPKKINIYIAKNFLIKFLQITLAFSLLIFFVNFLEVIDSVDQDKSSFGATVLMAFFHVPNFLNDIAPSLVLFAAIVTFFLLSIRSEITVIRSAGFSLWSIVSPIAISAFCLGIFWVTVFGPLSILMIRQYNLLEGKYIKHESREVVEADQGIWLRQNNVEKQGEEIIIKSAKVYKENMEFCDVSLWFFDKDGKFYQKIDAPKMFLEKNNWTINNAIFNNAESINKKTALYKIPTNLSSDFIVDKVVNNFQNVKLFSIFELPSLISSLKMAGFQSAKFEVYFQSLLSKPLLFLAMVLIACYFGINHIRNQSAFINIFLGIVFGLGLYITLSFVAALGSSRIIPVFASTWVITMICLAIGVLLIYRKEAN